MSEIPLFKVLMHQNNQVNDVLASGTLTQGKKVEELEDILQSYFDNPYVCTVNSATAGLTLAWRLHNLSPGDEILTCPLTCTATNWAILANNLNLRWVDVNPKTCNMDLDDLERKITASTKGIQIIHWAGNPIDLCKLNIIVSAAEEKYGHPIFVVEDCAHAFGAEWDNKKLGNHNNICVYSFQAIKHFTTGDGGAIILPSEELYKRTKLLRWFGIDRETPNLSQDARMEADISEWGYKFHMNDINAAIGIGNFKLSVKQLEKFRLNANFLRRMLVGVSGVSLFEVHPNAVSSDWVFSFKIERRDEFIAYANSKGVSASRVHLRNDIHSCVRQFRCDLPSLDELDNLYVSVPCGWWVTHNDLMRIVNVILTHVSRDEPFVRLYESSDASKNEIKELQRHISKSDECNFGSVTGLIFLVEYRNKVRSVCHLSAIDRWGDCLATIDDVCTLPEERGNGYAKMAIIKAVEYAKLEGCYKIQLSCHHDSCGLYESCGFTQEGVNYTIRFFSK